MILLSLLLLPAHAAESFGGFSFYIGDIHVHTGASRDGGSSDLGSCDATCGAAADLASIAVANGLDFFALTDHSNGGYTATPANFSRAWDIALAANDPRTGLVVIPGAEVHFRDLESRDLGHKTLLLFGRDDELASFTVADAQPSGSDAMEIACGDIWAYMADLEESFGPALLLPHHPALYKPMATDFSCDDPIYSPVVEVFSRHGNSLSCEDPYDPPWSTCVDEGTVDFAAAPEGLALRFGLAGGTDSHDTDPGGVCHPEDIDTNMPYGGGLTVAVLPEGTTFDRTALYDAFVGRQVYATSGPLLPALVRFASGGVDLGGMAEDLALPEGQALDVLLSVPPESAAAVTAVRLLGPDGALGELVSMGDGLWSGTLQADEIPAWILPNIVIDGDIWYAGEACDDGGADTVEHVWLSPTWVDPVQEGQEDSAVDSGEDSGDSGEDSGDSAEDSVDSVDTAKATETGEKPAPPTCGCLSAPAGRVAGFPGLVLGFLLLRRRR